MKMMRNLILIQALLFCNISISHALTSCERKIYYAYRKVTSTSYTCDRAQYRVVLIENSKATSLESLTAREEIANNRNSTDSLSCKIADAFGNCYARLRHERYLVEYKRRAAYYDRRIKTQQDRANRDCAKFGAAAEKLTQIKAECGL